ncbi:MAG: transporter [Desulfobacca sp.]|nr:transporter [Desulfobacca sp.]
MSISYRGRNGDNGQTGQWPQVQSWLILLIILYLLLPTPIWGATEEARNLEEAAPNSGVALKEVKPPSTFGPIITGTAVPAARGEFEIKATWLVEVVRDRFSPSWRSVSAGGDFTSFSMLLEFTYGLIDNMEMAFELVPYIHNWADHVTEPGPLGEHQADFGGLGDMYLSFKYQLIPEGPKTPTVTGLFGIVFPTGHHAGCLPSHLGTDELGDGTYAFRIGFNLAKWLPPFKLYANLWYNMHTDYTGDGEYVQGNTLLVRYHPRDTVTVKLAAEYPLTGRWISLLELYSTWDGGRLLGPHPNKEPTARLGTVPGIEYIANHNLSMALGLCIDLIGKNKEACLTPIFSMKYVF